MNLRGASTFQVRTGDESLVSHSKRNVHPMKRNLIAAVLAFALPVVALAQTSAGSDAAKTETKTQASDGSTKTEKKSTHKKSAKKAAPRHSATKRPSSTPAAQ